MPLRARLPYDPQSGWSMKPPWYPESAVTAYITLQIFGFCSLAILLATLFLSKSIQRDKSVYNLFLVLAFAALFQCFSWMTGGLSNLSVKYPPFALCIFQASLVAGCSTAQAASGIALVFRVWLTTIGLTTDRLAFLDRKQVEYALLALPWLSWLSFIPPVVVLGMQNPSTIKPCQLYCASAAKAIVTSHHYTTLVFALITILLELHLAYVVLQYYRSTAQFRRNALELGMVSGDNRRGSMHNRNETAWTRMNVPFVLRTLVFGVFTIAATAIVVYIAMNQSAGDSAMPDLVNSSVATSAFFAFGSQGDVLEAWRSFFLFPFKRGKQVKSEKYDDEAVLTPQEMFVRRMTAQYETHPDRWHIPHGSIATSPTLLNAADVTEVDDEEGSPVKLKRDTKRGDSYDTDGYIDAQLSSFRMKDSPSDEGLPADTPQLDSIYVDRGDIEVVLPTVDFQQRTSFQNEKSGSI